MRAEPRLSIWLARIKAGGWKFTLEDENVLSGPLLSEEVLCFSGRSSRVNTVLAYPQKWMFFHTKDAAFPQTVKRQVKTILLSK